MPTKNIEQIAEEYNSAYKKITGRVVICGGTGCIAGGSKKVYQAFKKKWKNAKSAFACKLPKIATRTI